MRGEKCTCCPYGYHIDVDFVKYAENVASGQYRQHLRQVSEIRLRPPLTFYDCPPINNRKMMR